MFRLLFGILKGVVIGAMIGAVLVASAMGAPAAPIAYPAAAAAAVLVSLVAGKKIWEAQGRVQVMLKAAAGLFLGPGLLWLVRSFANVPLPDIAGLPGLTLGSFAVTSLALVAAVLGGFYDLDNTGGAGQAKATPQRAAAGAKGAGKRVDPELAALTGLDPSEIEAAESKAEQRRSKQ